ncbi:MAG: hypothetical protein AB3N17_17805 [Tateyamaria sp.]
MEYGRREPMKSSSAKEPTAFTMKTIQELLEIEARQEAWASEAPTARYPMPNQKVQTPPHMRKSDPFPEAEAAPADKPGLMSSAAHPVEAETTAPPMAMPKVSGYIPHAIASKREEDEKPRSLLGRLIGR